jgi:hypothetical protein
MVGMLTKTILIAGLLLEILVLAAIYDTYQKTSTGGDIVHIHGQVPFTVDKVQKTYSPGTYVMTRDGLVRVYWYWVYQYWYLTVTLPIVLALALWWLSSLRRGSQNT